MELKRREIKYTKQEIRKAQPARRVILNLLKVFLNDPKSADIAVELIARDLENDPRGDPNGHR